jgi:hypothetical protein
MYLISLSGQVFNSGRCNQFGEAFAQNLVDAIIRDGRDYRGIILAGHSEGRTIAKATALAFLRDRVIWTAGSFTFCPPGLSCGCTDERQEIMSEFSGRFMSFVNTKRSITSSVR